VVGDGDTAVTVPAPVTVIGAYPPLADTPALIKPIIKIVNKITIHDFKNNFFN